MNRNHLPDWAYLWILSWASGEISKQGDLKGSVNEMMAGRLNPSRRSTRPLSLGVRTRASPMMGNAEGSSPGHMGGWFTDHFYTNPHPEKWLLVWQCERTGPRGKYRRPGSFRQERNFWRNEVWEGRLLKFCLRLLLLLLCCGPWARIVCEKNNRVRSWLLNPLGPSTVSCRSWLWSSGRMEFMARKLVSSQNQWKPENQSRRTTSQAMLQNCPDGEAAVLWLRHQRNGYQHCHYLCPISSMRNLCCSACQQNGFSPQPFSFKSRFHTKCNSHWCNQFICPCSHCRGI